MPHLLLLCYTSAVAYALWQQVWEKEELLSHPCGVDFERVYMKLPTEENKHHIFYCRLVSQQNRL